MADMNIKPTEVQDNGVTEEAIDDILAHASPEHRKVVEQLMVSQFQMRTELSPETEVMKRLTPDHITAFLETSKSEMEKSYKDKNSQRLFTGIMAVCAMVFVISIIVLLKDTPDVMEKVIYAGGGLVAGAIGGYGFGKNKNDD